MTVTLPNLDSLKDIPADRKDLAHWFRTNYRGVMPRRMWDAIAETVLSSISGRIMGHWGTVRWGYDSETDGQPRAVHLDL